MVATVEKFIVSLKSKPLSEYKLEELQKLLQQTAQHFIRFKGKEERDILNHVWNKMAGYYNAVMIERFGTTGFKMYEEDYLRKVVKPA